MINLYTIGRIGDFIRATILIYFFHRGMPPKSKKYNKLFTVIMILFYIPVTSENINNAIFNMKYNQIILFIFIYFSLVFIYPILFRKGRMAEKFFLSTLFISIIMAVSFIVYIIFSQLLDVSFNEVLLNMGYERVVAMLINRVAQFIVIFVFSKNIDFIRYIKDKMLYAGGIILFLNHILLFMIEVELIKNSYRINISLIIIISLLCVIYILSLYILNILANEIKSKLMLEMELSRKMHDDEVLDMYTKMVGWKHDFRNHMNMILGLVEIGNREEAISYINEMDTNISKLQKNIYTDNIIINSILVSKMKVAEEQDIEMRLDLKINSELKISNVDICAILGNLIDNSIESCSIIDGYRFIDLKIVSENDRFILKIINNTNGQLNEIDGKFFTTKTEGMNGIGLIQVDNIVEKYQGYINRKHENNIFITYMMI